MPGTLFVVATPIGNLEDFTFRGVRTLREVDLIAAEDTRRTARLLAHYDIQKPVVSLRQHNETRETRSLLTRLSAGQSVALVSDAGTPLISDPGASLVAAARAEGIRVVPIPGPTALATALSAAGLPADTFLFLGFPPSSGTAREQWLEELAASRRTTVFYEAPHRISRTIADISECLANRQIFTARELTKLNEELVEWDISQPVRSQGEFVVIIGPADQTVADDPSEADLATLFGQIADSVNLSEAEVLAMVAGHYRVSPVRAKKLLKKGRIQLKRSQDNQ